MWHLTSELTYLGLLIHILMRGGNPDVWVVFLQLLEVGYENIFFQPWRRGVPPSSVRFLPPFWSFFPLCLQLSIHPGPNLGQQRQQTSHTVHLMPGLHLGWGEAFNSSGRTGLHQCLTPWYNTAPSGKVTPSSLSLPLQSISYSPLIPTNPQN